MLKKILIAMLCALPMLSYSEASLFDQVKEYIWGPSETPPQTISILIVHDQPGALLEVKGGKYKLYDPNTKELIDTRFMGKRKYIHPIRDGLKWGEEFPRIRQIKIEPDNANVTTLVDGIEYPGNIYVYDIGGTISVVNELTLEEYLLATLIPQFKEKLSDETLAAVAIAARTNALFQAQNSRSPFWSVEAKNVNYEGMGGNNPSCPMGLAIRATKKMVMNKLNPINNLASFPAQWGSSTGGKTVQAPAEYAQITIFEAEKMAQKGSNAAQILYKAFPETKIALTN